MTGKTSRRNGAGGRKQEGVQSEHEQNANEKTKTYDHKIDNAPFFYFFVFPPLRPSLSLVQQLSRQPALEATESPLA